MTTKLNTPKIVGELREWKLTRRKSHPKGYTNVLCVEGKVYNHTSHEDGTYVIVLDCTQSNYRGRYLFGEGRGRNRVYYVAYKISMKED